MPHFMKATETIAYATHKAGVLVEPTTLKVFVSGILTIGFFMFGHLYQDALMAIIMLMVIDTILGVGSAYHNGEAITSRKFSRSVVKGIVYFMAISAGYFADLTVPFNAIQATMIAFIGVTEFISILENVGKLGYETPNKLLNNLKAYKASK